MKDIKSCASFSKVEPLCRGWSRDRKYYVETRAGEKLLLRLADIQSFDRKKSEFMWLEKVAALGLPTPKPLEFGLCEDGQSVYLLLTWCEGEDAEEVLGRLAPAKQYALGVKTGEYLRRIHSLPAPPDVEPWDSRYGRKARAKIDAYAACGFSFPGDELFVGYVEDNLHLLSGRPQSFQHGDYHGGNMVVSSAGEIAVIDFNRWDFGDPWEEFNRLVWSVKASTVFAVGQLRGYFGGDPPLEFFSLLAFYTAVNTLASIPWSIPYGKGEVSAMLGLAEEILGWFDHMTNPVPRWYRDYCAMRD